MLISALRAGLRPVALRNAPAGAAAPEPENYGMIATGNHVNFRLAARSTTLPYVPHPARTWQPLEHRNGQNLSDSASTTKADCSTLVRSADFSRCHPSGKKVGTLFVRTGSRLRCSSAIVSARRGFPRGRLSLREQGTQRPLVAFFWYFSWRSKKSTLRTS